MVFLHLSWEWGDFHQTNPQVTFLHDQNCVTLTFFWIGESLAWVKWVLGTKHNVHHMLYFSVSLNQSNTALYSKQDEQIKRGASQVEGSAGLM